MQRYEVALELDGKRLGAMISIPSPAHGIVIFAHGSGSGRHSPRNTFVSRTFNASGLVTLLLDMLTQDEDEIDRRTAALRFDVALLARRMGLATDWCRKQQQIENLRIGYFGASTGAGAALLAASTRDDVDAIVSRGGRPDLAGDALGDVQAPTLFIVGEHDERVIELNQGAAAQMRAHHDLVIVPGATHLFEEAGALEQVAQVAQTWFLRYLAPPAA